MRYADDFVVLCRSQAPEPDWPQRQVAETLCTAAGLEPAKTRITALSERL
ncbi:MAG: hypothetical protein HS126_00030 [Anaerolineales bacterium]|nr:hypothetical protein [Anaerolineales bacterium]